MQGQNQQYQLKIGVSHHPSIKTQQLVEFLQNQANQFFNNDLPTNFNQDKFVAIFQPISPTASEDQFSEYVGVIILYASSSYDSYLYAKSNIPDSKYLSDMFLMVVEMDNTEKQANAIGNEGEKMCEKMAYQFVRFSLHNSEDLVSSLQKNLYELIENYYYPNQEERPAKKNFDSQYLFHYTEPNEQHGNVNLVKKNKDNTGKILATKEEKRSIQKLLDKASEMRESRQYEITQQQKEIDESIENVERILGNIDQKIQKKVSSQWFSALSHTLYSPLQKNSTSFGKIKLTQQFLDQEPNQQQTNYISVKTGRLQESRKKVAPARSALINKFIAKHKKFQPILKLILAVADSVIVELDVFENSTYEQLSNLAIKKFGITDTAHNQNLMKRIISQRIQGYIKQLSKTVKLIEKQRIDERSFLKSPNSINNFQSLRSNY